MEEIITSVCVKAAKYTNNWKGHSSVSNEDAHYLFSGKSYKTTKKVNVLNK